MALYDDAPIRGNALLLWSDFEATFGAEDTEQILVRRTAGVSADAAHAALDTVLAQFPLVTVTSSAEQRDALNAELATSARRSSAACSACPSSSRCSAS